MKKIFLVDDDPFILKTMSKVLEDAGFTVVQSDDGADALEKIKQSDNVDLLITDIYMENDGISLLSNIKKSGRSIPAIAMSGGSVIGGNTVLLDVAKHMGAHIMKKPVMQEQLLEQVNSLLKND